MNSYVGMKKNRDKMIISINKAYLSHLPAYTRASLKCFLLLAIAYMNNLIIICCLLIHYQPR